jgi:ribosomal protein S27AE
MPSIVLNLTDAPAADTAEREPDGSSGPLFRGNGDIDYVCGNCGFVIVSGFSANQHVISDNTTCPACGATNEFPPELRA